MASPRPGAATTAQKSLAYKSPAVKTPASAHGHAHNVSVSSHPSSTPLAQNAIRDELLNLDSPAAALINSIASGQDGLGITTTPQAGPARDGQVQRSPEAERIHRLQQVVSSLRTKMVGRGVTREGVERVARIQGFEALWDEDNLTIAGNIVELEINFDPLLKDKVTDLVLKLNTTDGESHVQQEATTVIKGDFGIEDTSASGSFTQDLGDFSLNVQYLAQLDRINTTPNAFEIVGGLYKAFRDIWDEEKKRMKWRHDTHHLCKGSIGRPTLDRKPRLGVCLDYWRTQHDDDATTATESAGKVSCSSLMGARISCEAGAPSMPSSLEWLSPEVLQPGQPENVLDSSDHLQRPAWVNSSQSIEAELGTDPQKSLDAHFLCSLEPVILVPLNTALRMNAEQDVFEINQRNAIVYPRALQNTRNEILKPPRLDTVESRWSRRVPSRNGEIKTQSYALYSAAQGAELWFYPVSRMKFSHPRRLTSILPVVRQYAVLWTLLRNLVIGPAPASQSDELSKSPDKRRVTKRSNAKPNGVHLVNGSLSTLHSASSLNVDISLDVMSDPTVCKLEIFAPLPDASTSKRTGSFVHLTVALRPDGAINVPELSGLSDKDTATLRSKVSRMLSATEDIGMVLEWLVERERIQSPS